MKVVFLGTGTSHGVPKIGCECHVCRSNDPRDRRFRSSIYIEEGDCSLIIDTGPDFRETCLRHRITRISAILLTHAHADHIHGIDDIRAFNLTAGILPVYSSPSTLEELKRRFDYIFKPACTGGGLPEIELHPISSKTQIGPFDVTPLPVEHSSSLTIGFRVGGLSYIPDVKLVPDKTMELIAGTTILVVDALRWRPHSTHHSVADAIALAGKVGAKLTFFTHVDHDISHKDIEKLLPSNIRMAYDGLSFELNGCDIQKYSKTWKNAWRNI